MSKSSINGFGSELVVTAGATLLSDDTVTGDDKVTSDDTVIGSSVLFCCHYPTRDPQGRLSLMEQGVTIFTVIHK